MNSEKALKYCQELALQAITGPPPREEGAELPWDQWHESLRMNESIIKVIDFFHSNKLNLTTAFFGAPHQECNVAVTVKWVAEVPIKEVVELEYFTEGS